MFSCCLSAVSIRFLYHLLLARELSFPYSPPGQGYIRDDDPDTLSSLPVSALNVWFAVFVTVYRRRLRAFLYPGDWDSPRQLLHFGFPCLTLPSHLLFGSSRLRGLRKFILLPISSYAWPAFRLELPLGLGFASPACHPVSRNWRQPGSGVYPLPGCGVTLRV